MNQRDIRFTPKNNPRLLTGDFGFDWCDRCGSQDCALVIIRTKVDEFRLCKGCLLEGVKLIDKTILEDAVTQGNNLKKFGRIGSLEGEERRKSET